MKKRILAFFTAMALCLSAAACSRVPTEKPEAKPLTPLPGTATSEAAAQSSPTPAATGEPTAAPASSAASSDAASEAAQQSATSAASSGEMMRGMWVSYLEWSDMDFSSEEAFRREAADLMYNCAGLNLNTVFVQVRPFADALYPSNLFPWSASCSGTQGVDPGYDPLAILVEEAHAMNLKLHAWINPYRVANSSAVPGTLAADSLVNTHPRWVRTVGEAIYLDPSSSEVMEYITQGVLEILHGYDVDGIQFDDYFYPTTDTAFDAGEYAAYKSGGGTLALEDWRRENVNTLVRKVYAAIKAEDPDVVFGISPQGNNDNNYNGQYSDVALWMRTPGYVDYVMPQTYWGYHYTLSSGSDRFAFEKITAEWAAMERCDEVTLCFGLGAYRIGEGDGGSNADSVSGWSTGHTLADMVWDVTQLDAGGYALYRYDSLFKNGGYADLAAQECEALRRENRKE